MKNEPICTVTLITGDVVTVSTLPDGKRGFAIKTADPTKLGQNFQIIETPKGTYIFPEGVDLSKLDKELFNIDYLVREQYCNLTYLPVLVDYKDKEEKIFGVAALKELESAVNITVVKSYHSIPTFSAKLSFEGINETFKILVERPEIEKIWLDKKVKASLYESVPLIGAPELWKSGYNGSGLEIAILDTGIDDTHPDLDDLDDNPVTFDPKVIVKKDFTDDISTEDLYGHGTHCAGIAAGTGTAPSEPYPTPTPVPTPTVTPTPPSSSEFSTPMHLHAAKNIEQKVKKEVYSSVNTSQDAYEPDDNYWLANWIPTDGTKQLHNFHVPGDLDYVKFNATEDMRYLIVTSDLGNESDTYMYLFDTDGLTEIIHDDDSGEGLASRIVWQCDASGTYYVKVRHYSSSASGPNTHYNLSILEGYTPSAEFNDVYSDYGEDTDVPPDGLNNSLVINVGVKVTKAGRYEVSGSLYENATYKSVAYAYNTTYLSEGNQTVKLKFDGITIRQNKYNGTYDLRYLGLYNYTYPYALGLEEKIARGEISPENLSALYGEQLDYGYYAYTTGYYGWPGWQKPSAEFNDVYSDYGEDTDGDELNNSLVIEVGVNVTKAGRYEVSGSLYENTTLRYVVYAYNTTNLNPGNQTVQLIFDGIRLRQNKYNGTYDLRYLYLYNMTYPYALDQEEKIARGEIAPANVSVMYGEQLDYRYYAYTTKYYNWTKFQIPPAEFNDVYRDYGLNTTIEDDLYDCLVIEVGVNVTKAGRYGVSGSLYENGTYNWVDYATKFAYLSEGNQTIELKFSGIEIRNNGYNGTYDLKYLYLYNATYRQLDYRYYAYTTAYYNFTDFQEFPRYIGVAPGAYLWNVKVLNRYGSGYESWVINGVEYAALGPDGIENTGDEADIISMSLGGSPTDGTDPLSQAVNEAVEQGLVVAVAAGNAWDYFTISTPGAAEKAITVGASDKEDDLAYFSSKGPTLDLRVKPDVVAPGVNIIAPRAKGTSMGYPYNDNYTQASGTSMSTPHVAGSAALILQVHPDWTPEEVKNVLISTADDLGYNVYQQGGGRIYVPSAANPRILVDPATISFKNLESTSETITFKNLDTVPHTLTLDVSVKEMFNDTEMNCAYLNKTSLSIAPGSSASVLLTINDTSLAHSLYSGKVSATYSGGEVHSIFGFCTLNKVTVNKINIEGEPAVAELVVIFSDTEDAWIMDGVTDENGTVAFYLSDGVYQVISGWGDIPGASVYTIAENVSVEGDTNITLDERTAKVIDFACNKSGQIMSERSDDVYYDGEYVWIGFGSLWDYTNETVTYITPTNSFKSIFIYSYYPEEYYNESDRWLINAPEWHKLLYNLSSVTENVTFVADYDKLVERSTDYKVALKPELASWYYFAWHPDMWFSITTVYKMSAPLSRIEWLSPEPIEYFGGYEQYAEWWNETYPCWSYRILEKYYPAGSEPYFAAAEHPFKSGAGIDIPCEGTLDIYGTISEDTFGNSFANTSRLASYIFGNITYLSGNITVMADGEVIVDQEDIWDFFWGSVYFYGTPKFTVIIQGNSSPGLSTYTRTELNFIADPTRDYQPPGITMRVFGGYSTTTSILTATLPSGRGGGGGGGAPPASPSALYNIIPGGEVNVEMNIEDESNITHLMLEYSVNNGTTWNDPVNITQIDGNNWIANLGSLNDVYVSLRVNATDFMGNSISQTVIKGFYVLEKGEPVFDTGAPSNPYPSIFGTHNGTITPSQDISVNKLYTYPCAGTGGHTESIELYENETLIASGAWEGYHGDWHNVTLTPSVTLVAGHVYNYTIVTGSYPQIIHAESKDVKGGIITCTEFTDANGRKYNDWIPAIKLE